MTGIQDLPRFADAELATMDSLALIECLCEHADRVPRNLIDACVTRGEDMVQALGNVLDDPGSGTRR